MTLFEQNTQDQKQEEQSFEKALAQLEKIVSRLSSPECGLDESLTLFQEANRLSKFCREKLADSEKRIRLLSEEGEELSFGEEMR